jgi:crotonobetainyl-CoA:carnitine CoA-transferase CaiB-like acyl-CoA transferase
VVRVSSLDKEELMLPGGHGQWDDQRQKNMLDGGAPFYGCYTCADGKFVSIAAIEPQFYQLLLELCGIDDSDFKQQWQKQICITKRWAEVIFSTKSFKLAESQDVLRSDFSK